MSEFIESMKDFQLLIGVVGTGLTIFFLVNKNLKEWRKEHREDMKVHREELTEIRSEVSKALQTIAAHSVTISNLEKQSHKH